MFRKSFFYAAALGTLTGSPIAAQSCAGTNSCTVTTTASVTVPALVSLSVSGGGTLSLSAPGAAELATGYVQNAGPTFTVKANRAWTLSVHTSNASNFAYTGDQGGVKPISDLTWATTSDGTFTAITGSAAQLGNGAKTNSASPSIFFRTLYPNDYGSDRVAAGAYAIDLVFTVAAP